MNRWDVLLGRVALVVSLGLAASCSGSSGGGNNGNGSSSSSGSSGGSGGSSGSSGSSGGSSGSSGGSGGSSGGGSGSSSGSNALAYTLTVALTGDGSGRVVSTPAGIDCSTGSSTGCSHDFGPGSGPITVSLTATPSATSSFVGLGGGGTVGCNGQSTATTCPYTLNAGVTVTADVQFSAWQIRNPFPASATSLASSGGTLLMVGAGSAASTSVDGLAWTGHVTPPADLNAVTVDAAGLYVAVGNAGAILTTSDAVTWTPVAAGLTTSNLAGVASGAGAFVAVGKGGTIAHSADGTTWSTTTMGATTTQDLLAVTYGGGLFVATGYAGTILTSPDGVTWTQRGAGVTTQYLTAVTHGAQFVAVGNAGVVLTSPDATTWTLQPATGIPTTNALRGVAWSGTTYAAAGDFITGGLPGNTLAFTSPDGVTWTQHATGLGADCGGCAELYLGVAYADGFFYGLGVDASIFRSSDGATWTRVMAATGRGSPGMGIGTTLNAVAYGASTFVALGGPFLGVFTSSDGVTWTSRLSTVCCKGNSGGVAFGSWTTPTAGQAFVIAAEDGMHSSTDGLTWAATPTYALAVIGDSLDGVVYAGGLFVAVGRHSVGGGNYTGIVLTSPDGMTWTDQSATAAITMGLDSLAYGAGHFVAMGTAPNVSSDGVHWTPESDGTSDAIGTLAFGSGLFVGIDSATGTSTLTSPDGVTWTSRTANVTVAGGGSLSYGNGTFLAPSLATSTDGLTWTPHGYPVGGQLSAATATASGWIGVGLGTSFWAHP